MVSVGPPHASGRDELSSLVAPALAGEPAALEGLLVAVGPSLLRVSRQILGPDHPDVEDVVQESAFALIEALRDFRGDSSVLHFACRVALLTAMNTRRKLRVRERLTPISNDAVLDELAGGGPLPSADLVAARRRRAVGELLSELPAPQAEALALHCVLGFTVSETAVACAVPENTVRSRLVTAKAALKKRLGDDATLREELELAKGAG
ncbi:MAG TPA: sigma-70 family RNA polymerase sigma factor [Polyangiaceae bacterium]